ncbi:hypothetical protein Efla_002524 [Eimeria flavescens]
MGGPKKQYQPRHFGRVWIGLCLLCLLLPAHHGSAADSLSRRLTAAPFVGAAPISGAAASEGEGGMSSDLSPEKEADAVALPLRLLRGAASKGFSSKKLLHNRRRPPAVLVATAALVVLFVASCFSKLFSRRRQEAGGQPKRLAGDGGGEGNCGELSTADEEHRPSSDSEEQEGNQGEEAGLPSQGEDVDPGGEDADEETLSSASSDWLGDVDLKELFSESKTNWVEDDYANLQSALLFDGGIPAGGSDEEEEGEVYEYEYDGEAPTSEGEEGYGGAPASLLRSRRFSSMNTVNLHGLSDASRLIESSDEGETDSDSDSDSESGWSEHYSPETEPLHQYHITLETIAEEDEEEEAEAAEGRAGAEGDTASDDESLEIEVQYYEALGGDTDEERSSPPPSETDYECSVNRHTERRRRQQQPGAVGPGCPAASRDPAEEGEKEEAPQAPDTPGAEQPSHSRRMIRVSGNGGGAKGRRDLEQQALSRLSTDAIATFHGGLPPYAESRAPSGSAFLR